jgi:caffeoyl-CoA O-methyltransferase
LDPIFEAIDRYIRDLFVPEDDALIAVAQSIVDAGMPQISVSPIEGKLLHFLARLCGANRILEIGTLAAYSTIWLARALPATGQVVTIEADPAYAKIARANLKRAGVQHQVSIRVGRALDVLPAIEAEGAHPFDMIFIDADKPPYAEYLEWALRLSRPGSLIVADNVIREGKVLDPTSTDDMVTGVQRFNAALAADGRVDAIAFQSLGPKGHDGMALALVR